jgi:hypothetical protein
MFIAVHQIHQPGNASTTYAGSFARGMKPVQQIRKPLREEDVLARCMRLARCGKNDEAESLLDEHCSGNK